MTLKIIMKYIGIFLAISGAITIIWKIAVYFDDNDDTSFSVKEDVTEILNTQKQQQKTTDSIFIQLQYLRDIKSDVNQLKTSHSKLINNLALHMSKDETVTKDDLLNFLQDFQKEIKKNEEIVMLRIPLAPIEY